MFAQNERKISRWKNLKLFFLEYFIKHKPLTSEECKVPTTMDCMLIIVF